MFVLFGCAHVTHVRAGGLGEGRVQYASHTHSLTNAKREGGEGEREKEHSCRRKIRPERGHQ